MNERKQNFSDRIKQSFKQLVDQEVTHLQEYERNYKISSHPIKLTFNTISRLNKLYQEIPLEEVSLKTELSENDIIFIIQEFIAQRLIDGVIEERNGEKFLILKQITYLCQIDQEKHSIFELHFQCTTCLRFICTNCYKNGNNDVCPYCKGDLVPVPRIFKKNDVESVVNKNSSVSSIGEYYHSQKAKLSESGFRSVTNSLVEDFKKMNKRRWSFSKIKDQSRTFLEFRKQQKAIEKYKRGIIDTITMIHEVEGIDQIPLERIAKINKIEISIVNNILRRLIETQHIQGFLETSGTYDTINDDLLIVGSNKIKCYIHEAEISISAPHFKCSSCFRSICSNCYATLRDQGVTNCVFCRGELEKEMD